MNVVIEELKNRITAIEAKVKICQGRLDSYRQNRLFEIIKDSFIGNKIRKKKDVICDDYQPVAEESKSFFWETCGVNLQIIRRMQNGYKTCKIKLMLKNMRR